MNFIGNNKAVNLLSNSFKRGKINHAYLFCGPENVGKFTLAKMFAMSLIKNSDFSLDIKECDKDTMMDLLVVEPEIVEKNNVSKQRDISIEQVRDAKLNLSLFPYHGKYKILIVNDAHRMNSSAQNGLLKTLEEPNKTTIIILITHEASKILPTILSRCQVINFGLVDEQELEKNFSKDIVDLSLGRPGIANNLFKDEDQRQFITETCQQLKQITAGSLNEKINMADKLSKDVVKTIEKLNIWLWQLRKNVQSLSEIEMRKAYYKMEKIQESLNTLKSTNANARLILETLFLDF